MVCDEKDDVFKYLMQKYQPLIYKLCKPYQTIFKKFGYEVDDLIQIGYIALYKASSCYDIYNEVMFYTYFKRVLNNSLVTLIRFNTTNKKEILNNALSYDLEIPNSHTTYLEIFSDNKASYDYTYELTVFKNSMPFMLSSVFELYYNGYTKEEISLLLGEKVDNIKELLSKIKAHALTYKYLFFE